MQNQTASNIKLKFFNFKTNVYFETVYRPTSKKYPIAEAKLRASELLSNTEGLSGAFILALQPVAAEPTYPDLIAFDTNL